MKQSSAYKTAIFPDLCIFEPAPPVGHGKNTSENMNQIHFWNLRVINLNTSFMLEERWTGYVDKQPVINREF